MKMLNGYLAVKVDEHYKWYLDSNGNPFLEREHGIYDVWEHSQTSGIVVYAPEKNHPDYKDFTDIEVKEGDRVIFHYLAIQRDVDGKDVNTRIDGLHILQYHNMYGRIRDGIVTPLNGWIFVKGLTEEIKTTLIVPDHLKNKKSEMLCEVCHTSTPVKNHFEEPYKSWPKEEDDLNIGQKVLIPKWAAVPIQNDIHSVDKGVKGLYRVKRHLCVDYEWVKDSCEKWTEENQVEESNTHKLVQEAYQNFRLGSTEEKEGQISIHKKLRTKYTKTKNKFYLS